MAYLIGDSVDGNKGGICMQPNRKLKITGKSFEMPESTEVGVPTLASDDSLKVVDIGDKLGFGFLKEDDYTVVTVKALIGEVDLELLVDE